MAPAGGSQSLRQFKVAHVKRKADEELKRGNYGHAADRYSEAIAVLVPPATAAGQPLPSLPAGPQHTSTPNTRPPSSLELLCPSSLHTAAADPETSRSTGRSVSDAANHSHQLAAPRVPAGDVPELRALLSNRSLALLKAGQAAAAVEDASCAIALAPCWPKGHWRMAKAFCELKRWSDALDCFARAWSLSEPGSAEQGECEQQLLAVVQKLTRQGLADRLLAILQSRGWRTQHDQQHQQPMLLTHSAHAAPSPPQLQQGVLAASTAATGTVSDGCKTAHAAAAKHAVRVVDSTAAAVDALLQACHGEELREAMFQLVKAAVQQQQPPACRSSQTVNKMQAILVKWLILHIHDHSSSASSADKDSHSRIRGSCHVLSSALPAVLGLELQLLTAQLAVKVKRWSIAQVVAADLQHKLAKLVLQDEGVLLQLLVDCHIILGEALWAAGPDADRSNSSSTSSGASSTGSSSSSSTALAARSSIVGDVAVCCQPYKAAAACLTALDLLPIIPSATGSNNDSSTAASETHRGSCVGPKPSFVQLLLRAGQRLVGDAAVVSAAAEQLRKDVQGRLDAALEQLNDLEQAAVWARAAAAGQHGTSPQPQQDSAATKAFATTATAAPAARCAAATATAGTGPVVVPFTGSSTTSSSSTSGTGWELACIQLDLRQGTSGQPATQVAGGQQSLLVTVRVESLKHSSELDDSCSTESRANSGSSTCASNGNRSSIISSSGGSSVNARGLSGAARVAVLRGIARAAGVGSLSVGLGQIQLAPPAADMGQLGTGTRAAGTGLGPCPEGGKGSVHYLTFKVQFGADAAAAARFAELCHSLASLVAACPELAAALVGHTFSAPAAKAVQLKPDQDHNTSSTTCAGSSSSRSGDAAAAAASRDSGSSADAADAAGSAASGAEAAAVALYHIAAVDVVDLLRAAAANTSTTATPDQDKLLLLNQPQQQQAPATAVSEQQHGPGAAHQDQPDSSGSSIQATSTTPGSELSGATTVAVEGLALAVASCDVVAMDSSTAELVVVNQEDVPDAAAAVIPLPYAHYRLVGEDGRMVERPDKHPFALSRVLYDARELPSSDCEVWYEAADGAYRWRQTSSTVFLKLHALPDSITSAKELTVTIAAYSLRVLEQGSGELLFEAGLVRGIVPEDSTWVFVKPERRAHGGGGSSSSSSRGRGTADVAGTWSRSSGFPAGALMLAGAAAGGLTNTTSVNGQHILFELSKMNLELYERPNQHSASWWPRLFADDAADIAWDDAPKDYSDLPPAIAAAAAAEAAREDELRREQHERQEARNKTQVLVDRHKQYRAERLRELKAAAWNAAARSSISNSSSTDCSAGSDGSTSSNTSSAASVMAAELSG